MRGKLFERFLPLLEADTGLEGGDNQDIDAEENPEGDETTEETENPDEGLEEPGEGDGEGEEEEEDPFKDFVPKAQVNQIVKNRVNRLNEKLKTAESAVSVLDTISTITGVPVDQIAGQLRDAAAQAVANNKHISLQEAKKEIDMQISNSDAQKLAKRLDYDKQEVKMLKKSDSFPMYEAFADDIKDMAETKGISLEDAYVLVTNSKSKVMSNYQKKTPAKKKQENMNRKISGIGGGPQKKGDKNPFKGLDPKAAGDLTEADILAYSDESSAYDSMLKILEKGGKK